MWIITKTGGFMSVVEYNPAADREKNSPFKALTKKKGSHVLVRARVPEHLEDLKRVVPTLVIDDQPYADYRFRAVIKRSDWKKYLNIACDEIDYGSHFKEVTRSAQPVSVAEPLYRAMMSIWGTLATLQRTRPYSGRPNGSVRKPDDWGDVLFTSSDKPKKQQEAIAKAVRESSKLSMDEAVGLIKNLGRSSVSEATLSKFSDDALEFYIQLQEKYGAGHPVSEKMVDDVVSAMAV